MDSRFPVICIILILVLLAAFSGCTSTPIQQGATAPSNTTSVTTEKTVPAVMETVNQTTAPPAQSIADQLALVKSDNVVWSEAYRIYMNMKTTEYVHTTSVDEALGDYKFDCLGFVDYVLSRADTAAYNAASHGYARPEIAQYAGYFNKLDTKTPNAAGWTKVEHPLELKPGDICLWLKPTTLDLGHMWIIAGTPKVNPSRPDEVLVRIFDSDGVHSDDSL